MKAFDKFTRDERNLLLYFETCMVDGEGLIDSAKMNIEDIDIARKWNEESFLYFGRVPLRFLDRKPFESHAFRPGGLQMWVRLTEQAWEYAHLARRHRSEQWIADREKAPEYKAAVEFKDWLDEELVKKRAS